MIPDIRWIVNHKILHRDNTYWMERNVVDYINRQSGTTFLDVGSNKGFYSHLAKKRFAQVVSIEPDLRYKYNHPLRYFITNHKGSVSFYYNEFNDLLTLNLDFHVHGAEIGVGKPFLGTAITYDDLYIQADVVKLDVEGAEFDVLCGMNSFLPQKIIVELHDERRAEELCNTLIKKGYDVSMLDGYHFLGELQ